MLDKFCITDWLKALFCAVTLLVLGVSGVQAAERVGVFKKVNGQVELIAAQGGTSQQAQPGMLLHEGDRVVSKEGAGAAITLRDGSELMLGAKSSLVMSQFQYNSTTQSGNMLLNFLGGQLRMITGLMGKNSPESVKVKTPVALIGVRGTDFIIDDRGMCVSGRHAVTGIAYTDCRQYPQQ